MSYPCRTFTLGGPQCPCKLMNSTLRQQFCRSSGKKSLILIFVTLFQDICFLCGPCDIMSCPMSYLYLGGQKAIVSCCTVLYYGKNFAVLEGKMSLIFIFALAMQDNTCFLCGPRAALVHDKPGPLGCTCAVMLFISYIDVLNCKSTKNNSLIILMERNRQCGRN